MSNPFEFKPNSVTKAGKYELVKIIPNTPRNPEDYHAMQDLLRYRHAKFMKELIGNCFTHNFDCSVSGGNVSVNGAIYVDGYRMEFVNLTQAQTVKAQVQPTLETDKIYSVIIVPKYSEVSLSDDTSIAMQDLYTKALIQTSSRYSFTYNLIIVNNEDLSGGTQSYIDDIFTEETGNIFYKLGELSYNASWIFTEDSSFIRFDDTLVDILNGYEEALKPYALNPNKYKVSDMAIDDHSTELNYYSLRSLFADTAGGRNAYTGFYGNLRRSQSTNIPVGILSGAYAEGFDENETDSIIDSACNYGLVSKVANYTVAEYATPPYVITLNDIFKTYVSRYTAINNELQQKGITYISNLKLNGDMLIVSDPVTGKLAIRKKPSGISEAQAIDTVDFSNLAGTIEGGRLITQDGHTHVMSDITDFNNVNPCGMYRINHYTHEASSNWYLWPIQSGASRYFYGDYEQFICLEATDDGYTLYSGGGSYVGNSTMQNLLMVPKDGIYQVIVSVHTSKEGSHGIVSRLIEYTNNYASAEAGLNSTFIGGGSAAHISTDANSFMHSMTFTAPMYAYNKTIDGREVTPRYIINIIDTTANTLYYSAWSVTIKRLGDL